MAKVVEWERQIGRRLAAARPVRLLHWSCGVRQHGQGRRQARRARPPRISQVIAALEHAIGVRLLDRSPTGVVTTRYGDALLARGRAGAFDELRLGIRDIEFLADPHAGELRVGCPESLAAGVSGASPRPLLRATTRASEFMSSPVRQPTLEFRVARTQGRSGAGAPGERAGARPLLEEARCRSPVQRPIRAGGRPERQVERGAGRSVLPIWWTNPGSPARSMRWASRSSETHSGPVD